MFEPYSLAFFFTCMFCPCLFRKSFVFASSEGLSSFFDFFDDWVTGLIWSMSLYHIIARRRLSSRMQIGILISRYITLKRLQKSFEHLSELYLSFYFAEAWFLKPFMTIFRFFLSHLRDLCQFLGLFMLLFQLLGFFQLWLKNEVCNRSFRPFVKKNSNCDNFC